MSITTADLHDRFRTGEHLTEDDTEPGGLRKGVASQIDFALMNILAGLETLDKLVDPELQDPPSARCLFTWLETIEAIRRSLAFHTPDIAAAIAKQVKSNEPQVDVPSAPVVKWSKSSSQWDNEALEGAVRKGLVSEAQASGLDESAVRVLHATISQLGRIYRLAGSNVRLTALRELDIDPDEYCARGEAKPRVQFNA
jgi:hypothetical protein